MVILCLRFRKGRIDQIVGGGIHPFQKIFGIKLVVRFEMVHLRVSQMQRVDVPGEVAAVVIPEDQLPGFVGEFGVQKIFNLLQI